MRIDHVIHYSDKSAVDDLRYALSYLAKQDQKEHGIILGRSRLPEKSNRGRPRHNWIMGAYVRIIVSYRVDLSLTCGFVLSAGDYDTSSSVVLPRGAGTDNAYSS